MTLLLLALGCAPSDCSDEQKCPDDTGGADDSGGPDDTAETADTAPVEPCSLVSVDAAPIDGPVNNQEVRVTLDGLGAVEVTCTLTARAGAGVVVLPERSTWAYWDGAEEPEGWTDPAFDDGAWSRGPAPLGWGEAVATEIGYGPDPDDKQLVAWFRATATLDDPSGAPGADVWVTADDGAVVYLNGVEVGRVNLPEGPLDADTPALDSVEATRTRMPLDPALLVAGENVVAVGLHQSAPTTSDAWLELELTVDGPGGGDPEEVLAVRSPRAEAHVIPVRGLLADATYTCAVAPECAEPAEVTLTTGSLPAELPVLSAEGAMPTPGYVLFNWQRPCTGHSQQWFLMVDPAGEVRWYDAADGVVSNSAMDIEVALLPDHQRILWGGGESTDASPHLVDLDGRVLYEADYPGAEGDVYHHDVEWTADETILGLVMNRTRVDSGRQVTGFDLVEHDPETGAVVWEWSTQDAVDRGQIDAVPSDDPWHANAFASTTDALGDAVYVNLYYPGLLIRIDKATGDVTHVLGRAGGTTLLDAAGAPLGDSGWFDAAHGTGIAAPGRVLQYDNGVTTGESRVVVYAMDVEADEARLVTEWSGGWFNPNWGDADELPDGGLFVNESGTYCFGGTYEPGRLTYVDAAGEVAWRARFGALEDASYRAQWIDGCDLFGNQRWCAE